MNYITNTRGITEDFAPMWSFSGVITDFTKPLSAESRKQAEEIIAVLNNMLENK